MRKSKSGSPETAIYGQRRRRVLDSPLMTHDQMISKWMENPEFRKAVFELNAQYAVLDQTLMKETENCSVQPVMQVNRNLPFRGSSSGKASVCGQTFAVESLKSK